LVVIKSAKFIPPAVTWTMVCGGFGTGTGASSTARESGPERLVIIKAFMEQSLAAKGLFQDASKPTIKWLAEPRGRSRLYGGSGVPLQFLRPVFAGRYILLA
jgi:hypothetical protein